MISRVKGTLVGREPHGTVEVETAGGVVYEVDVPLTVLQRMPQPPAAVELRTLQVVRDDSVALYGFLDPLERELFRRMLAVHGVGTKVALGLLSTYSAARLARAIAEKDAGALRQVSGVGRKIAEQIVLDLSEKLTDLAVGLSEEPDARDAGVKEAVAALVALGYSFVDADQAVRAVVENGGAGSVDELIRKALSRR